MAALCDTNTGRTYPLRGPALTVGRYAECDIQIKDRQVSGRHATILRAGDAYYLSDLGSSNGTFVNGKQITESTQLRDGDVIDLCGPTFEFVEQSGVASTI